MTYLLEFDFIYDIFVIKLCKIWFFGLLKYVVFLNLIK